MPHKNIPYHERKVFTTGDLARVYLLSQQTVIRMYETGKLKGFRVPGSTHRRISYTEALKSAQEHGLPHQLLFPPELRTKNSLPADKED